MLQRSIKSSFFCVSILLNNTKIIFNENCFKERQKFLRIARCSQDAQSMTAQKILQLPVPHHSLSLHHQSPLNITILELSQILTSYLDLFRPIMINLNLFGLIWIHLDLFRPIWTPLNPFGLIKTTLSYLGPFSPFWKCLDKFGSIWTYSRS